MRNSVCLSIILLFAIYTPALAQSGESSFEFLLIGPGSRAAAMGEASTAISGDVGAPYFNPASAGFLDDTEFSFMHISYLTDVTLDHFSLVTHSNKFRYGMGLYYGKVANIQRRDLVPTEEPLGTFDEHNFTASFFWAIQATDRFAFGNAIKWAYEKLDISSASAVGLDLGAFYKIKPQIYLGASVRNIGTKPKFETSSFDLPRELRLGISYKTFPGTTTGGLILAADYVAANWGNKSSKLNIGSEYTYQNLFAIRMGYDFGYDSRNFSIGGGLAYKSYFFDYAFVPSKHNLSDTHRFTFRIKT
ncbi:MAG TPA: hypothetical protein DEO84_02680 [candidate division Zixibacteria bacterium]|nr:hypothetical protein [candidate division Zixibacteria bacterium]